MKSTEQFRAVSEAVLAHSSEALLPVHQKMAEYLVYNTVTKANPDYSVKQPTAELGMQTIELLPADKQWDILGLIVHPLPTDRLANEPDILVSLQLCQEFPRRKMDFVRQFRLFFYDNLYWANDTSFVVDLETAQVVPRKGPRAVWKPQMDLLNQLVEDSPTRPADC